MAFVFVLSFTAVMGVESIREREDQESLLAYLMDAGEINQEMVITLLHFTFYVTEIHFAFLLIICYVSGCYSSAFICLSMF